jgi:hypothetical protein
MLTQGFGLKRPGGASSPISSVKSSDTSSVWFPLTSMNVGLVRPEAIVSIMPSGVMRSIAPSLLGPLDRRTSGPDQ